MLRLLCMPLKSARNHGFTLVELLLVISIMLIMAGAMIPSFNGYLKNQSLKQAQERLKSDLRTVQNKALTGALYDQTVDVGSTGRTVTHWGVRFNSGSNRYDYFIAYATTGAEFTSECNNAGNTTPGDGTSARYQGNGELPSDMVFKSPTGCLFFDFKNGATRPSPPSPLATGFTSPVYFGLATSNATGDCRNIRFNWSGLVFNTNADQCSCSNFTTCQ